ncbi:acyl-CoA thioesterase [Priestia megaterium]|nr:acyl-CoA thioesterase [Priestia megaterium]
MKNVSYIHNIEEWKCSFTFKHEVKVRFSETDMFGHLNNTVPFVYFEEARIAFLQHLGFMSTWTESDSHSIPVVADLQCDYIQQVFFDERLSIYVKVERIGTSSVDLHYMALNSKEHIVFVGRGTMVQISKETGKGEPWTEEMKRILRNQLQCV